MTTNKLSLLEFLLITIYLGLPVYISGLAFQIGFVLYNKFPKMKVLNIVVLLALTRITAIILTMVIWCLWFLKFDILLGFFLLPAILSEIILFPMFLKFLN